MLMLQYYKADDYYFRREIGSMHHYPGLTKIYGEGILLFLKSRKLYIEMLPATTHISRWQFMMNVDSDMLSS